MHRGQDLRSLMDRSIFADSDPPVVVADADELLGYDIKRTIRVPASKNGINFSSLFRAGRHELQVRFLQGQERVIIVCESSLLLQRLSTVQFRQLPGPQRRLDLAYMQRPAFCAEIVGLTAGRLVTVPDLCHVMCQRAMIPYVQNGVLLLVLDVYGAPLLVRVVRVGDEVEVRAYLPNDPSVLPRSYLLMSA